MARFYDGKWVVDEVEVDAPPEVEVPEVAVEEIHEAPSETLTAEEATWKKRYGDLRSHSSKLEARLKAVEAKLSEARDDTIAPSTESELEEWLSSYPDTAKVVNAFIQRQVASIVEGFNSRFESIEAERKALEFDKAYNQLLKAHPDFPQISKSAGFAVWVEDQPKWITDALYAEDSIDVKAAIRAIDLYKYEVGAAKKKPQRSVDKDASAAVKTGAKPAVESGNGKKVWKESEVAKLSAREYDRLDAEITLARREGRFEYDLSGASR